MCDRWRSSFQNFLADMGRRPQGKHTIDRVNNDGNYEPGNCRWATWKEQHRNTSQNVWFTYRGERLTASEWCERLGMMKATFWNRIYAGWAIDRVIETPVGARSRKRDQQPHHDRKRR